MFEKRVTRIFNKAGIIIGGSEPWDIRVKRGRFYPRVAILNSLGLGRSYIEGDFECDDIYAMLRRLMEYLQERKEARWFRPNGHFPASLPEAWIKFQLNVLRRDAQSIGAAFNDIGAHYNEGNDFFRIMQDTTETYSCALFFLTENLDQAQKNKYRHIGSKADLRPGMQVADIGCGWGYGAAFLARIYPGVTFHCFTVAKEQFKWANEAYADLIAEGRLKFYLMDYREIPSNFSEQYFDAVYSIGMLEHVGPKHYKDFRAVLLYCTKPHRPIVLHYIVGNGGIDPFIWYYIFRGGFLPTFMQMRRVFGPPMEVVVRERFGPHYAKTLRAWRMNVLANRQKLLDMGYTEEFIRKHLFYLAACEVAFEIGTCELEQRTLAIGGMPPDYEWHAPSYAQAA